MKKKKKESNDILKDSTRSLTARKFWRIISQIIERNFSFKLEFYKWLRKRPERKQLVINLYRQGYNQIEIACALLMSPLKVRRLLKDSRKSLEWNIKTYKWLED